MSVTLGESLNLLEAKKQRIREITQLRNKSTMVTYEEGDTEDLIERPEHSVDNLTAELSLLRRQVRKLQLAVTKSNVELKTDVEYEGEFLTLGEVLVLIKELREELPQLNRLAEMKSRKTKQNNREYVENQMVTVKTIQVQELTFTPETYREKARNVEKLIQVLQSTITRLNVSTLVDFTDEEFSA